MNIKAVIFDLDETLYDGDELTQIGLSQAVKAMIGKGLNCNLDEGRKKINAIIKENPLKDKFIELAMFFGPLNDDIIEIGRDTYWNSDFDELKIYPEGFELLESIKNNFKNILITQGTSMQQNKKIDSLKIRDYFDHILIPKIGEKKNCFLELLKNLNINPEEILVVGDRIDNEIKIGNELGMKTVRLVRGKYRFLEPRTQNENPDFQIKNLKGLFNLLNLQKKRKPKIVAIGGGTGLPTIMEGLREYTDNLTMIVTVTDSGRSSGMLRKDLNVLPPGDLRNCLISLSNSDRLMKELFQYRFDNGSLNGHNFGNLFIVALTKITGSFEKAIIEAGRILKLKGRVLPSTFDNVHICAELENGEIIEEENNIIDRSNPKVYLRSPIKKIFLKPSARANEKALLEIENADLIVLCPGSLYTSVISNLLVDGISESINKSRAKKVYVSNIMTQVSQTYNYRLSDHLKKIMEYLSGKIDYVIANNKNPLKELLDSYKKENGYLVENDVSGVEKLGVQLILGDFLDDVDQKKILWEKKDLLRHNPQKIAKELINLI